MHTPERRNILIVEDDSLIGWSMANALGRAGFNPVVVECGEAAIEQVRGGSYQCIISDFRLPGMDGIDLAGRVKALSDSLPIIIISAHEEISADQLESALEIDYFVEKPFNLAEIVNLVQMVTGPENPNLITGSGSEK